MDAASLRALKRVDLQRLAKDHKIKANLKNETLIELLLQHLPDKARTNNAENVANPNVLVAPSPAIQSTHAQRRGHTSNSPQRATPDALDAPPPAPTNDPPPSSWSAAAQPESSVVLSTDPPVRGEHTSNSVPSGVAEGSGHPLGGETNQDRVPQEAPAAPLPALSTGVSLPQALSNWSAVAQPGSSAILSTVHPVRGGSTSDGASLGGAGDNGHRLGSDHATVPGEIISKQVEELPAGGAFVGPTASALPTAVQVTQPQTHAGSSTGRPAPQTYVRAAADKDPAKMTPRSRRRALKAIEAKQEAARRRVRAVRGRRRPETPDPDDEPQAGLTEAECIHMVRVLRRTHNAIEWEHDKLLEIQDRAREVLEMSNGYIKLADANRAHIIRIRSHYTYLTPCEPEWTPEEIWGQDPMAHVYKTDRNGQVHEQDEETGPLRYQCPNRSGVDSPTIRATPMTPLRIKKRKQVGNYVPPLEAKRLFDAINAQAKQAEDGPARKRRRLAPPDREHANALHPKPREIPAVDRPLPGNWWAVDEAIAKTFFVPSSLTGHLTCRDDKLDGTMLKSTIGGLNEERLRQELAPYAWAPPRFVSCVDRRQVHNVRTGVITAGKDWTTSYLTTSAIGYLTYDGHVDPDSVPFGPLTFGPDDAPAPAATGPAAPAASTSFSQATPVTTNHPTARAGVQGPPLNESNQPPHPWFQFVAASGVAAPTWYREQAERLRKAPPTLSPAVQNAPVSTGLHGSSEGPRVFRIRYSVTKTTRRGYLPAQNASSTAAPAGGAPSQTTTGQSDAPQRDPFFAVSLTAKRTVYEWNDPTFYQIDLGEQVLIYGWYFGDMYTPPAIGVFRGWSAWTQDGAAALQNAVTAQQQNHIAAPDSAPQQTNGVTEQQGDVTEQQPDDIAEQQSDIIEREPQSSEDSVEPISGVAARIINAERSFDRDSAAEARRYLSATRRASVRDNTNSPTTPRRSHAEFVLEEDAQRLSSLPPSDPPQEDTSSIAHEGEGAGPAVSEADSLPDYSDSLPDYSDSDEYAALKANLRTRTVISAGDDDVEAGEGAQSSFTNGDINSHPVDDVDEFSSPPPRRTTRSRSRQPVPPRPDPLQVPRRRITSRTAFNRPTGGALRRG